MVRNADIFVVDTAFPCTGMLADRIGGVATLMISSSLQALGLLCFAVVDSLTGLYLSALIGSDVDAVVYNLDGLDGRVLLPAKVTGDDTISNGHWQDAFATPKFR